MAPLEEIVQFCNDRTNAANVKDFPGAFNGLQFANNGSVTKIGAAVDSGLVPFQKAIEAKIDFLIVHHGMYWNGTQPVVETEYEKTKLLVDSNLAVYSSHLPLDAHPEIGNNALLAKKIGIQASGGFANYEGIDIGLLGTWSKSRSALKQALQDQFGDNIVSIEYGSESPTKVCVLTGSGASAVEEVKSTGADTLITGELKQHFFNVAQERQLNLYACGHYATETFGVRALAEECAEKFGLEWEFIGTECPL